MKQNHAGREITALQLRDYEVCLGRQEKSAATIKKYLHSIKQFAEFLGKDSVDKEAVISWKKSLRSSYAPASVNVMLAAVNSFLEYYGWGDCRVKPLKIQRDIFCREEKELKREEYLRLVKAARAAGNERLALVLQTICTTGIRVSELEFITVEAVQAKRAVVNCKGKNRTVFLTAGLAALLRTYLKKEKRTAGPVFITKTNRPLNRSNIWRDMKKLCECADVNPEKVFPHNLRHLFARTYYTLEKDLSRLADILGHTNVNTTRIYTMESGAVHARQLERMGLVVT